MPFMPIYAKFIRHIGIKKGNPPSVEDCLDYQVFIAKEMYQLRRLAISLRMNSA
jgi:hypothetical protein